MRIPILPKWAYSDLLPAFHDVESGTAIQQTAKLYAVIKGMVDDYNKFAEEVNITVEKYMCDVNTDQEQFKNEMTKLIHDYIITIDAKIAHQDREIQESIVYIKNNIGTAVTDVINQMKESGELTEELTKSFEDLGVRVGNLETTNTQIIEGLNTRITVLENEKVQLIYDSESESISFQNIVEGGIE